MTVNNNPDPNATEIHRPSSAQKDYNALPMGLMLQEYRIDSVLGSGGFGITYLAHDVNLNCKVAIKEYLPGDIATRVEGSSVQPKSSNVNDTFLWGKQRFLDESRTLASFHHPNIVRVMRFFEANQTAYMVMEYQQGYNLKDWMAKYGQPDQNRILSLTHALLDGLEIIHAKKYLHRDIKPGNIYMKKDHSPVLLDFGSARQVVAGRGELTSIVTPGYAPFEQYYSDGNLGPWSDIYSFAAVLYWIVTAKKPIEAAGRVKNDAMPKATQIGNQQMYSTELLRAIDWGLVPDEKQRPQNAKEWRQAFPQMGNAPAITATPARIDQNADENSLRNVSRPITLSEAVITNMETFLSPHVGPIASVLVRKTIKKSTTLKELCDKLAGNINDDQARRIFLQTFSTTNVGLESKGTTTKSTAVEDDSGSSYNTKLRQKFGDNTLQQAEFALAKHIGAVAKVVVKRAAQKARDRAELYLLIAQEIPDEKERKLFVARAISEKR